jgi:transglutaminase-like putative cysteine protease
VTAIKLVAGTPLTYLGSDDVIDVNYPEVQALSERLAHRAPDAVQFAKTAFNWVRDSIRHSLDAQEPVVTISASQTLQQGLGLCFAKSHLLTALLRAQGVPAGLCYQRLTDGDRYFVHGLVAVHVNGAWHRQDPRGNKPGVDAHFDVSQERLAWPTDVSLGEVDYSEVLTTPHHKVLASLRSADDALVLCDGGLPTQL